MPSRRTLRRRSKHANPSMTELEPRVTKTELPKGEELLGSAELKAEFAKPSDSPDPDSYKAM